MKPSETPLRPDHSEYRTSIAENRKKIEVKKSKARKELDELSARLKIDPAKKIPNLKSASLELQKIYEELDKVSNINSDINDLPELFQRLIDAEHEMCLAAKYEQFVRLQSAEYDCSRIEKAIEDGRLFDVPEYTTSLQDNLKTLDEIPSITEFESRNEELKKLLDLLSQSIDISSEDSELNQLEYRRVAAKIFASFSENSKPFFTFLDNRDKPATERDLAYVDAKWGDNSDEILDRIEAMIKKSIEEKTASKNGLELDKFRNQPELFSATIEKLKLEHQTSEIGHEIEKLRVESGKFKIEIGSINKEIQKIKNPQNPFEQLVRSFGNIFRNFVKALPTDGFLSKIFSSFPKSKSQKQIETHQEKIEELRAKKEEIEIKVSKKLDEQIVLGREVAKHEKLLSDAAKSEKKDSGEMEARDQKIAELDAQNKKSAEKLERLSRHKSAPKAASRADIPLKDEITEGLDLAKKIESDPVIQAFTARIKARELASQNKKKAFENRIKRQFHSIFEIAKRVQAGDVKMIPDALDMSLSGLKVVVDQISVPIIQQALAATLALAKFAHERNRKSSSDRVSEVGKDAASSDLIDEISNAFTKSFSHMVDGQSPLDRLSEKGVEKFADTLVLQLIGAIGAKSPPWTADASAEQSVKNCRGRDEATDAILSAVAKEENFSAEVSEDGEEVLTNQTSKLAHAMVGWALHEKEEDRVPKQFTEFFGKVRFEDEDLEDSRKTPNWNAIGLAKRAGIVDSKGNFYSSSGRIEGKKGKDSKYAWRLATPKEEEELQANGKISGYENFTPASITFGKKLDALLDVVEQKDFKDPTQLDRKEVLFRDLIEECVREKLRDTSADLHKFLKTKAGVFLNIGTSHRTLRGTERDEARLRFGKIEELVLEAVDVKFEIEQNRISKSSALTKAKAARGLAALAAVGGAVAAAVDRGVDLAQVGESIASAAGATGRAVVDAAAHADESAAAAAEAVTGAARSVAAGAADLARDAAGVSLDDVRGFSENQSLSALKEFAAQSGLVDKSTQYQAALTDVVKSAIAELQKTKKHPYAEKQLAPVFYVGCLVNDFLDEAAKEEIEKFSEPSKHKDYKGYEDVLKNGVSHYYARVKRFEGKIIDVKLFQKSARRFVGDDREIPLFKSADSNEISPTATKIFEEIFSSYREEIERVKAKKIADAADAAYVAAQRADPAKKVAPSSTLTCGFSVEATRPTVTDHREAQKAIATKQELEIKLKEIMEGFSGTKNMEGMKMEGTKITMPAKDGSPFFLSFNRSDEGVITDVKLHSKSKASGTALPLYEKDADKIKEPRITDIAILLHFYSRLANDTPNPDSVQSTVSHRVEAITQSPHLLTS
jgi:hypothetical protein